MTKKTVMSPVWVVVATDGYIKNFPTQLRAMAKAQEYKNYEETEDVYILEVTKAWIVDFPEEPSAEVFDLDLDGLP